MSNATGCSEWPLITTAVATTSAVVIVIVAGIMLLLKNRRTRKRLQGVERHLCTCAIETTRRMRFPGCFVTAAEFVKMGRLRPYEQLRDEGKVCSASKSAHNPEGPAPRALSLAPVFGVCV